MITDEKIARINALARKKKTEGLSDEELKEQQALRQEYLEGIRANFRSQLDSIRVVDDHGQKKPLKSKAKAVEFSVDSLIPGLKPESEYTDEEKAHVAELSDKLGEEYRAEGHEE